MFTLVKPNVGRCDGIIGSASTATFSYDGVGSTRDYGAAGNSVPDEGERSQSPPEGYMIDHNRVKLGHGEALFDRAKEAIWRWQMFNLDWVEIVWASSINGHAPIQVGTSVAVLAKSPIWSFNPCRIVYTVDESVPKMQRFGFGYGTLPGHVAKGEERFQVEWHHADDSVWYDILAFSQPNHMLTKVGYPMMRLLQKRFAHDSKAAMLKACNNSEELTY